MQTSKGLPVLFSGYRGFHRYYAQTLRKWGFDVLEKRTPQASLEYLQFNRPEIIFQAHTFENFRWAELPADVRGVGPVVCQFLREIRKIELNRDTPIIVPYTVLPKNLIEDYAKAGANMLIDMFEVGPNKLIEEIAPILREQASKP